MARGSDGRIFHGGISDNSVTASGADASSEERSSFGGGYDILRNVLAIPLASHFLVEAFPKCSEVSYTF